MVNMKSSKDEREEYAICCDGDGPEYPYGLRIDLRNESLEKLGIQTLPAVGDEMMVMAKVKVVSVGSHSSEEGKEQRNVDLQITEMELAAPAKDAAQTLFGS